MSEPTLARRIFNDLLYRFTRSSGFLISVLLFNYRIKGKENLPATGPVLILCNHQSNLDPVLVGVMFKRKLTYLAKKSLFNNPLLAFLIRSYDAVAIDRERGGIEGLRNILAKLKENKAVLIFPEGTRSRTGELLPIKGGFLSIARRSEATLLPMSVVGGCEILTKNSILPRRRPLSSVVGEPISFAEYQSWPDAEVLAKITASMQNCWTEAHQLRS